MDLKTMTYIVVGATFALYIGIAIWARAGSTSEFYAAGQGVNPIANGMATAADWMSAASFISMAGLIAFQGYEGAKFLMGWTGGYVLLALLLAPYLRKFGKFTVPEFIGDRFYSNMARLVAILCLITISITYVIGQMKGVGVAFSRFLEVDVRVPACYVGMIIVFFYAVLGGMKGITYTQIAQYCVLITAYTIPAVFISLNITGTPIPQLGLIGDHAASGVPLMEKINQTITDLGFKAYDADPRSYLDMTLYTLSLMIGTAGLPHVIIRFFTVPKVSDARWSAGWALVFIALLYTVAPAVGSMARLTSPTRSGRTAYRVRLPRSRSCRSGSRTGRTPVSSPMKTRTATAACSSTTTSRKRCKLLPASVVGRVTNSPSSTATSWFSQTLRSRNFPTG